MSTRKTPRKTAAETRAYERLCGYGDALEPLRKKWRDRVMKYDPRGKGVDPIANALWELLRFGDCEESRLDTEYKKIAWPRIYDHPFDMDWHCHCGQPDQHPKK